MQRCAAAYDARKSAAARAGAPIPAETRRPGATSADPRPGRGDRLPHAREGVRRAAGRHCGGDRVAERLVRAPGSALGERGGDEPRICARRVRPPASDSRARIWWASQSSSATTTTRCSAPRLSP